jgi:hypothetical protein
MKLSKTYNLKVISGELAQQWHPTKNNNLTPDRVTPGSNRKAWWVCHKGHEWQAIINNRNNGSGCPYCSGKRVSKEYSLSVLQPGIASEWHPTKNNDLTPDRVTPGSNRKAWWVCHKGHEWQAIINKRIRGDGCPYCSGRRVSKEYNLSVIRPKLAKQWHPVKNGKLTPDQVTPHAKLKVWWKCDRGHEWKALISNRSIAIGCPNCASNTATREHNLMIIQPDLAQQWHPTKNGIFMPEDVTPRSIKRVWWRCHKGHEWEDVIIARAKYGNACPYCHPYGYREYNLSTLFPHIARQWHPNKNGKITPEDMTPGSKKKAWWICDKGHEWQVAVAGRTIGRNCPYCMGVYASDDHNLQLKNPALARQWHPSKNGYLKPQMVTPGSRKKVWWICDKGHEWQAVVYGRSKSGCPYCSKKKKLSRVPCKKNKPGLKKAGVR